jgi:hypothetical protein
MDLNLSSGSSPDHNAAQDLRAGQAALFKTLNTLIVLMIILSFAVNIFLFRQASSIRAQAANARRQSDEARDKVKTMVDNFQRTAVPQMSAFINQLATYASTDPSFAPVLQKYIGQRTPGSPPPSPSPAPLPPAAKK